MLSVQISFERVLHHKYVLTGCALSCVDRVCLVMC